MNLDLRLLVSRVPLISSLVLGLAAVSCTGTETTNPLTSFEASDCKGHGDADASVAALPAALATVDAGVVESRTCVSYRRGDDDTLAVRLGNFGGPCGGVAWDSGARFDGDTLLLQGKNGNPGCLIARCGGCVYDLLFEVNEAPEQDELPLRVEIGECADDSITRSVFVTELTLPLGDHDQATLCLGDDGVWSLDDATD
jgi:hypothetical protein